MTGISPGVWDEGVVVEAKSAGDSDVAEIAVGCHSFLQYGATCGNCDVFRLTEVRLSAQRTTYFQLDPTKQPIDSQHQLGYNPSESAYYPQY